jgi:multidrug efflux pump subunit AcrA (membrane-fusion protein)
MHEEYRSMNPATTQKADNPASTNGSPAHDDSMPPQAPDGGRPRRGVMFYGIVGAVVLGVISFGVFMFLGGVGRKPFTGPTAVAKNEVLRVTIVERGSLESAENSDIVVRVKSGAKASTNASIIKWVVDDGTQVKAGDKLVDLDDSGFQDQLKSQRNTVNTKYSDWVQAKTDCTYQAIQNESDIKTADVNRIQKELDLKKYAGEIAAAKLIKMESQEQIREYLKKDFEDDVRKESVQAAGKYTSGYLQEVGGFEGNIETTKADKESWLDRAAWSTRMVKKGFYSLSQADADQSRLQSTEIALRKAQGDLDIYRIFDCEKKITTCWSDVKEAERNVKKVKIQAESKMEQKRTAETTNKSVYDQELDRQRDMEKDEKFYTMVSPQDGMVVYFVPEQARFGSGSQQATVAQGEPVREGQKLMRIPNLSKMMVNARVHEAMISKVYGELTKPTHFGDALRRASGFGRRDLFTIAAYKLCFEELREPFRDKEFKVTYPGQQAKVRVDAFPGKTYTGHVKSKATVASQADFLSSDVKVYQTMVSIDDLSGEKLQPGMSAEVTILADATDEPVLQIPIQSIVGNVAMGEKRKVWVLDGQGIAQERDVEVGKSNDKSVQIVSGLAEGEKVVLNPRSLLPEKTDLKVGTPGTRRGWDGDESGGKKGGGKKGGPGTGGPPPTGMPPGMSKKD